MTNEHTLTSAQHQLWIRAEQAMREQRYHDVLFYTHCLLKMAPEFLEAWQRAREAGEMIVASAQVNILKKLQQKIHGCWVVYQARRYLKKNNLMDALLVLATFLGNVPRDLLANRLLATVALRWHPPLHALALFALQTARQEKPQDLQRSLDIATLALLPDPSGEPWNLEEATAAYQHVLSLDPHHLQAQQGLKNATALLSIKNARAC